VYVYQTQILCCLLALVSLRPYLVHAQSTAPVALSPVIVSAGSADDPLSPSPYTAAQRLRSWPGNVGLVSEEDYDDRATLSLADALSREPGVYVRPAAGQQSAKISIRGSGLDSPLGVRGVVLLRDGLPLNQADGVVDPSYADPFNARYIEVYRGSNALR